MEYVDVILVDPNDRRYKAKVDKDADEETLLSDLVEGLGLPRTRGGKAKIKYGINLINGSRIRQGITIQIYEVKPRAAIDIKPLDESEV
jgi:hypothetical protein